MLDDRFDMLEEIGRGAQARTFRARDTETDRIVAVKELDIRRVDDWKSTELFEREGTTLRGLDHPSIPAYIDAFTREEAEFVRFFLVQEFVDGMTLQEEVDQGRRWTEVDVVDDLHRLLDVLEYLHGLDPPVIHRDIKPSNVIRRLDGTLALVDFGAVQNALPRTVGGSTVVGTPGYMPMEQLMGRAVPATDLFALGATAVHLLSRVPPAELPMERNRLAWKDHVDVDDHLRGVLERMLEPSVEDRYRDATAVRRDLELGEEVRALPGGSPDEETAPASVSLPDIVPPRDDTLIDTSRFKDGGVRFKAKHSNGLLTATAVIDGYASSVQFFGSRLSSLNWVGVVATVATVVTLWLISPTVGALLAVAGGLFFVMTRMAGGTQIRLDVSREGYELLPLNTSSGDAVRGELTELMGFRFDGGSLVMKTTDGERVLVDGLNDSQAEWMSGTLTMYLDGLKAQFHRSVLERPAELPADESFGTKVPG